MICFLVADAQEYTLYYIQVCPTYRFSPNTISLNSDCFVATVDTFITNICSVSLARAVTDSVTGWSKFF